MDGYWSYLARYALITVWEADHPRSLAHPQHNHCGQHLHTHSIENYLHAVCFHGVMWVWKGSAHGGKGIQLTCPIPTHIEEGNLEQRSPR